jgi:hypothetical protein
MGVPPDPLSGKSKKNEKKPWILGFFVVKCLRLITAMDADPGRGLWQYGYGWTLVLISGRG